MRNPIEVLKHLSEKSHEPTYRFQRLYRNLYNPEFYWLAYRNIYANKGSMTPGADGITMDGISDQRIARIIASLQDGSYAKSKGCAWGTMDTLPEVPGIALRFDGHVGVYIGGGYAVEERGFNYGCVKTKVSSRKWTHWYQLPFVDYGDAVFTGGSGVKPDTPKSEYTLGTRTLKKGAKGTDVKALQEFLMQLGYALPRYGADGEFGTETEAALKKLQAKAGIKQDGVYGSDTHKAMMDAIADNDAGKEPAEPDEPSEPSIARRVRIVCDGGTVNIRVGNGTQYERITAVPNGTSFEWVATAENGWHAAVVGARVVWVSGKYSKLV